MKPDLSFLVTLGNATAAIFSIAFFGWLAASVVVSNFTFNPVFDILYARIGNLGALGWGGNHSSSLAAITLTWWYIAIKDKLKGIFMLSVTVIAMSELHDMIWNFSYHSIIGFYWPMDYLDFNNVLNFSVNLMLFALIFWKGDKWQLRSLGLSTAFLSVWYLIVGYWLKIPETLYNGGVRYATSFVPNFVEVGGWIGISLIMLSSYILWRNPK